MKSALKYIIVGLFVTTVMLLLQDGCNPTPQPKDPSDSLKTIIRAQLHERDSLLGLIGKKDSVRVEYLTKWKKIKEYVHDPIPVPCDSILPVVINACDSVIYADSSLISTLKKSLSVDSFVITNQDLLIKADSVKIADLNKEIKKHKRHKRWLIGALSVTTILAIIK